MRLLPSTMLFTTLILRKGHNRSKVHNFIWNKKGTSYVVKSEAALRDAALTRLSERGVTLDDIADLVMFLQEPYFEKLEKSVCLENVKRVINKREVQNAIITGTELDMLAEKKLLSQPLQNILYEDEGLYGIDEIMALAIVNVYGSIGFTNYGYIDKVKPGILKKLNS